MKNLYNTIEQNLKVGLNVVVQDLNYNYYCAISTNKDEYGNYRDSGWEKNVEEANQCIGEYCGYSKKYWDGYDLEIVEVYRPEYEPFQVGDKVRILDSIKKTEEWNDFEEDFSGMIGEIKDAYNCIAGTKYRINGWYIGHEYLAPLEEQEDNVALEAIKLLEEKGYRIIKK